MEPALTPEEWADDPLGVLGGYIDFEEGVVDVRLWAFRRGQDQGQGRHALAALALHGQPFGFTRADVELLRCAAVEMGQEWDGEDAGDIRDLADRIAALLPPE